jgi:signal transduction histidine kinase
MIAREHPDFVGYAPPGRMGVNTAVVVILLGIAFALRDVAGRRVERIAEASALCASGIALLAVVGHVLGARTLYSVGFHTQMAAQSSAALLALSMALLVSRPERGVVALVLSTGSGGFMARRMIPVLIVVPTMIGWLSVSGVRAGLYDPELGMSIDVALAITVLLVVVLLSARTLNRIDDLRRRGEERILALNERLVRRTRDLEDVNQQLESFSYSVSHDLRAPIRHIGGFSELLEKRCKDSLDDKSRHYVDTISASARRAGALIDDLLAFSRMSRAEMKVAPVDMERVVRTAWKELATERAGRDVELVVGKLPRVAGDASMLHLVFSNLLSNAIKYTRPRDKARIEVAARTDERDPREVTFSVRDNGVGFDMRYVGKLFGVFQRLHKAESFDGVGIGLANVKRIVQRHGGRVWAEGDVGNGATFFFALPKEGSRDR